MRWSLAAVVAVALGVFTTDAFAETRFVAKGGSDAAGCTDAGSPCATIGYAVGQAASGDTIQIGPGFFEESVTANVELAFVGGGGGSLIGNPGGTTIQAPVGNNAIGPAGLKLPAGGAVRSLRVQGGDGDSSAAPNGEGGGAGIEYSSSGATPTALRLEDVVVVGGDGGPGTFIPGPGGMGIEVRSGPGAVDVTALGSEFAGGEGLGFGEGVVINGLAASADLVDSRIANAESFGNALTVYRGARVTLEGVEAKALQEVATIYDGSLTIRRSRLRGNGTALYVVGSNDESPEVELIDSLAVSDQVAALYVESEEEAEASAKVLGSTLIGRGPAAVYVEREEGAGPATATLRNSIARHLPLSDIIPPADLDANGGTIDADFSSFTTRREENGGTVTAPGSAHNLAGDPGFLDAGNDVFILQNTSPLIDRGDPGIVQAGELDLGGAPRSLDGNRDCMAAPDIGAFEVTGQSVACPVDPKPTISGFGMTNRLFAPVGGAKGGKGRPALSSAKRVKHGTRFTYTLSEPARVAIAVERKTTGRKAGRGSKARCVKPTRANSNAPRCVRFVKATSLTAKEQAGKQSTPFSGLVRGKPLKSGRYRASIVATDSAGQASEPRRVSFRIVSG